MEIQNRIESKLSSAFEPVHLEVVNESHNHNVPPGSESHFKVTMVCAAFEGKNSVARHRLINKTLADELANHVHALSLKLWTPQQWQDNGGTITHETPECAHKK